MAKTAPDAAGYFGPYGGRYVPETLMAPVAELARAYDRAARSRASAAGSPACCATGPGGRPRSTSPSG